MSYYFYLFLFLCISLKSIYFIYYYPIQSLWFVIFQPNIHSLNHSITKISTHINTLTHWLKSLHFAKNSTLLPVTERSEHEQLCCESCAVGTQLRFTRALARRKTKRAKRAHNTTNSKCTRSNIILFYSISINNQSVWNQNIQCSEYNQNISIPVNSKHYYYL